MDDIDRAQVQNEMFEKVNLYRSHRDEPDVHAIGECLYCGEPIAEPGRRWCDAECRDGWEDENA